MTRENIYQLVTDRIIAALEAGTCPWRRPWVGGGPINIRNKRPYRGINTFLLGIMGYADPRWGTFKAIAEVGGHVRKGEKATWVILWKPVPKKRQSDDEEPGSYLLLKSYPVFNALQADDVPPLEVEFEHDPIERADEIVRGYADQQALNGPLIQFSNDSAYYSPSQDLVGMPDLARFVHIEGYYSTLYHELVHSTGHKSRLDRLESGGFGSGPYAKEELVAEMGAAMLCGIAGIDNLDQSAAYVDHWASRLREDSKLVVQAAAQAQKAADLILGETFEDSQETENPSAEAVAA
jgi:antirestriction protein ArdC